MKPKIFIGSSKEGLPVAQAIQIQLDRDADVIVWTDNAFQLSRANYENLERQLGSVQFGIFVLSSDDVVRSRGKQKVAPRDNVIFELGMFVGNLGLPRTFIVHPRNIDLKMPSDLLGITTATYELPHDGNYVAAVGAACSQIRMEIGTEATNRIFITWNQMSELINKLGKQIKQHPGRGGFNFDIIIGISGGGIIVADLLARKIGRNPPILCLWAERRSRHPDVNFEPSENWISPYIISSIASVPMQNILVIDDLTRTGSTIVQAKRYLERNLPDKRIKNAVLIADISVKSGVDYIVEKMPLKNVMMPFAHFE